MIVRSRCPCLVKHYISQASAKQRAGRTGLPHTVALWCKLIVSSELVAGRLFPGTVFRMYPQSLFENRMNSRSPSVEGSSDSRLLFACSEFDTPEMLRVSL